MHIQCPKNTIICSCNALAIIYIGSRRMWVVNLKFCLSWDISIVRMTYLPHMDQIDRDEYWDNACRWRRIYLINDNYTSMQISKSLDPFFFFLLGDRCITWKRKEKNHTQILYFILRIFLWLDFLIANFSIYSGLIYTICHATFGFTKYFYERRCNIFETWKKYCNCLANYQ